MLIPRQVAFLAMVEDAAKHQAEAAASVGRSDGGNGEEGGASGGTAAGAASSRGLKEVQGEEGGVEEGEGEGEDQDEDMVDGDEGSLATGRLRRTPKRGLGTPGGNKVGLGRVCV